MILMRVGFEPFERLEAVHYMLVELRHTTPLADISRDLLLEGYGDIYFRTSESGVP